MKLIILIFTISFASIPNLKSIYITPVKIWQHLSYSYPILNCQFKPSCSNYFIHAVDSVGVIGGTIIAADRVVRCNPSARHYHLLKPNPIFHIDGRLIDFVGYEKNNEKIPNKFLFYSIIPGLGRAKTGRKTDGLFSFLIVSCSIFKGFKFKNNHPNKFGFFITLGSLFWIADFYGTKRIIKSGF